MYFEIQKCEILHDEILIGIATVRIHRPLLTRSINDLKTRKVDPVSPPDLQFQTLPHFTPQTHRDLYQPTDLATRIYCPHFSLYMSFWTERYWMKLCPTGGGRNEYKLSNAVIEFFYIYIPCFRITRGRLPNLYNWR